MDYQKQELEKNAQKRVAAGSNIDKEAVEMQNDYIKKIQEIEQAKIQEKKMRALSIMEENIKEKRRAEQEMREKEKNEDQLMQFSLKRIQEEEERKQFEEIEAKKKLVNSLKVSYAIQGSLKKQQTEKQKELDKKFLQIAEERSNENEKNRQKVLIHYHFMNSILNC